MLGHPKQRPFHQAAKTHRKRFFFGANQSGKTTAGIADDLAHALGYYFYDVPDLKLTTDGGLPHREQVPLQYWIRRRDGVPIRVPNTGVITTGLTRARGLGENIWPSLKAFVPAAWRNGAWKLTNGPMGIPENIVFPNGSKIILSSEEQDDFAFEGFVADWWHCDEPCRAAIYNAMQARLIKHLGPQWFTLTPLGARSAWMLPIYLEPPADTFIIEVDQTDNPGLTDEMRAAFAENGEWSERERDARLHGRFEVLGDRVIDRYDPAVHRIDDFLPPRDWIHGLTVDPHFKRPAFMVWWAFHALIPAYYFYREWPSTFDFFKARSGGLSPSEYATLIRNAEGAQPARIRICDPRFGKAEAVRHGFRETSWVDRMAQYGLHFDANVPNTGSVEYGHQILDDLLKYDKNFPIGPANTPRLFICKSLKHVDKALRNYGFLDVKDPVKGLYRKVSEEFKDPIDTLRYTVLYPLPATDAEVRRLQRWTPEELERFNDY